MADRELCTTDTLREKVADALYLTYHGEPIPHNASHTPFCYAQADAAIAAVMEALQTPTEAMLKAPPFLSSPRAIWLAMLAAMKLENGR